MKTALCILAVLLAAQCASAGFDFGKKDDKKAYSYGKTYAATPQVVYQTVSTPKTVTYTCTPKPVTVTADPVLVCPSGCTSSKSADGKLACAKQVCQAQPPAVVYVDAGNNKYAPTPMKYGRRLNGYEKKSYSKDVSKNSYGYNTKVQPVYYKAPAKVAQYVPQPPVCTIVAVAPVYTCSQGTLSGNKCIVGSQPGPCPSGYTPSGSVCTKTTTVMVQQQVATKVQPTQKYQTYVAAPSSYVATPSMASYGWGKKKDDKITYSSKDYVTYSGAPAQQVNYCTY